MRMLRFILVPAVLFLFSGFSQGGWVRQNSVTKRTLYSVCFIDTARGWAAGDALIKTTDGGLHWTVLIDSVGLFEWNEISFVDSLHGWCVFPNPPRAWGVVSATTDGGLTWHEQANDSNSFFTGVKFVSPTHGYVAGGYTDDSGYLHSRILSTTDGGISWRRFYYDSTSFMLEDIDAIGSSRAWAVGSGDSCCLTTNGGATWFLRSTGSFGLDRVSFGTLAAGWGSSIDGYILASTDSGMTWHLQLQSGAWLNDIKAVDSLHAWAVGMYGKIWVTSNGGQVWLQQTSGTTDFLQGITFLDVLHGWVVVGGSDSLILHTDDGGTGVGEEPSSFSRDRTSSPSLSVSPNPFASFASVPGHSSDRFSLYDISGRKVGVYKGDHIGEGLVPGVYFIRAEDQRAELLRVVKIR